MVSALEKQLNSQNKTLGTVKLTNGILSRKSLLFDSKEVLSVTKDMVYTIGLKGLSELCTIDKCFKSFSKTIFSEISKDFEFYTQDIGTKEKIQKEINSFLMLLSPYVMIKASMYCLEWLIYQYHIYELCWSYLVQCMLPHHDTRLFPRVIQLIDFDCINDIEKRTYTFLKITKENPVPIPKKSLVSHIQRNPSLLVAVSQYVNHINDIVYNHGSVKHEAYSIIYSFYGSLAYASINDTIVNSNTNTHIRNQLLYNVIDGLTSNVDIIRSTNVMILLKILDNTRLTQKQIIFIIKKIVKAYGIDLINLHIIMKCCQSQTFYFTIKLCKLLIESNNLGDIHNLLPNCNLLDVGEQIVDSIGNFLAVNELDGSQEKFIVLQLSQLFSGWRNSSELIKKLVTKLVQIRVEIKSNISKELLIEIEKLAPSILVEFIGKRLLECRETNDMTNYQNLYDLLSICLTKDSMSMHNVNKVNLPLLLCVYNSNIDIRADSVFSIRDFLANNDDKFNGLSQVEKQKLKDMIHFLIYKNPANIVISVLNELQYLPSFTELFDIDERIAIFKYTMNCILTSPDKWIEAITVIDKRCVLQFQRSSNEKSSDYSTFIDVITILLMVLKRFNQDEAYRIFNMVSNLLSYNVVKILNYSLNQQQKSSSNDPFTFFECISQKYIMLDADILENIMNNFGNFKTLSKYSILCLLGVLNVPLTNRFLSHFVNDLNHIKYDEFLDFKMEYINSWRDIVNMMDVTNYTKALIFMLKSILISTNINILIDNELKLFDKDYFYTIKSLFYWICDVFQQFGDEILNAKKCIQDFLSNKCRFQTREQCLQFIQLCIITDYNTLDARLLIDLYEIIYCLSTDDYSMDRYLIPCFLLMIDHTDKSVRQFPFTCPTKSSMSSTYVKLCDYFLNFKSELINCPTVVCNCIRKMNVKRNNQIITNSLQLLIDLMIWYLEKLHIVSETFVRWLLWISIVSDNNISLTNSLLPLVNYIIDNEIDCLSYFTHSNEIAIDGNEPIQNDTKIITQCLTTIADIISKGSSLHKNNVSYMALTYEDILQKWSISTRYGGFLIEKLDENFYNRLNRSTVENLTKIWLNKIIDREHNLTTIDFRHNDLLMKSLRKCPLEICFVEELMEDGSPYLNIVLELMQSNNYIRNKSLLLPKLFKHIEWLCDEKKYYQLQLVLNCCEIILCEIIPNEACKKVNRKKGQSTPDTLNISCLLSLLDGCADSNKDELDPNPNFSIPVMNILKYLSILMPTNVLDHLVSVFISIGNLDRDDFYTTIVIQNITKNILPIIVNTENGNTNSNLTKLSLEDVIVSIVDAFPHIPHHRHLTLCTGIFDIIDREPTQKYTTQFLIQILHRNHDIQEFCINFFESRSVDQQIGIMLQLYEHLILMSHQFICTNGNIKTPDGIHKKLPMKRSSVRPANKRMEILFDNNESCVRHQIIILSLTCYITQKNVFDCHIIDSGNDETSSNPNIYTLLEKILVYSECVRQVLIMIPSFVKLLRHVSKQCDDCIANIMDNMPVLNRLKCMDKMLSSDSSYVRRRVMDLLIIVIVKNSGTLINTTENIMTIMNILEKLTNNSENIVINEFLNNSDTDDLQSAMCCIKCITCRIFSCKTLGTNENNMYMDLLNRIFIRLIKLYDVKSKIPTNSFVTVNLAVCELMSVLSVNVFTYLFPILETIFGLIIYECTLEKANNNIKLALLWFEANITSLEKIFSVLGNFCTSKIYKMLDCVLESSVMLISASNDKHDTSAVNSFNKFTTHLITNISENTGSRIFIPKLHQLINDFIPKYHNATNISKSIDDINLITNFIVPTITQHINHSDTPNNGLTTTNKSILQIYFDLLNNTSVYLITNDIMSSIDIFEQINQTISNSFSDFILKHSEKQCYDIINKFFIWSTTEDRSQYGSSRNFIFYYIINELWLKLRSIMLLFVPIYLQHSVDYLGSISSENITFSTFITTLNIVQSFTKCCEFDRSGFIDKAKVSLIVKPLITIVKYSPLYRARFPSIPNANSFVENIVAPAISAITTCTKENQLFLHIQSEILTVLQSNSGNEQILCDTLVLLEHFYVALGDSCSSILPELSPVLMEIMEEDSILVMTKIKKIVSIIENITGESMNRYL